MSKSLVIDKLNLHPKSAFYFRNKGEIDINPQILAQEVTSIIPPQYKGDPAAFPYPLRGTNPFSAQKFYSKRTVTSAGQIIFAKIPFVDSTNNTTVFTKPYRTGFECNIYFQYQQEPTTYRSLILNVIGSIPTTQDVGETQITTATNLSLIQETTGDFEVSYVPVSADPQVFVFLQQLNDPFTFFVGRDPSLVSFNDNGVDTSSPNFLYLGGSLGQVGVLTPMIIKTIFTYI